MGVPIGTAVIQAVVGVLDPQIPTGLPRIAGKNIPPSIAQVFGTGKTSTPWSLVWSSPAISR